MGSRQESPTSAAEAAELLRACAADGLRLRPRGGGTKIGWGYPTPDPDVEVMTANLGRILEHNAGDLTAVLEAGVPLAHAQRVFAEAGQMLALDPPLSAPRPLSEEGAATIGGIVATGDSGPQRHRYGAPRDLVLGITVALSDGTLARAGGKVIKNVAGYDLAKLFAGSFGTLGMIVEVVVRLHPRPVRTCTAAGRSDDPRILGHAALVLAQSRLQMECLDLAWRAGKGALLARFGGAALDVQAEAAVGLMEGAGLDAGVEEDDDETWERQRRGQRSERGAIVKVSGLTWELPKIVRAVQHADGAVIGRAGLGLCWLELEEAAEAGDLAVRIEEVTRELAPLPCRVLDAPDDVRDKVAWSGADPSALPLMRRIKARFDPAGVCNPGLLVRGM